MTMYYSNGKIPYDPYSIKISHNLNYPLWHLEDVLYPLFSNYFTRESVRDIILSANHIWCAYEHGKCVGCSLVTDIGSHGGLYMLLFGIRKSAQGQGIGRLLLDNIIIWSITNKYNFMYLHTEYSNKKAIGLYENAGFKRVTRPSLFFDQLPRQGTGGMAMLLILI